jgi:uncharacterized cupredoxin-like copper-binding protein
VRLRPAATAVIVTGFLLAGCAANEDGPTDATAATDVTTEDASDEPATDDPSTEGVHEDEKVAAADLGEPADASEATRTIAVDAFDMAFEPAAITVEPGEVVTFEVSNTGEAVHEFFLGDPVMQQDHADEMAEMGHDMAHDEPYSIRLDPGETKQLTWRFTDGGEFEFACHEPGHYGAGMHGRITVG